MADEARAFAVSNTTVLRLYPAFYLVHIVEEYYAGGGLAAYLARAAGAALTYHSYILMNGIGWALMIAGIVIARRLRFSEWYVVCISTILLANGLAHALLAVLKAEYNPGLASGLLLFIPCGAWTLLRLKARMRGRRYAGALVAGLLIHLLILLLTVFG
jgi:hypothetical protein